MITIRKSVLRRFGIATAVVAVVIASVVSVASASSGATITSPSLGKVDVYVDANNNGRNDPGELVGTFTIYPGSGITLSWAPYHFPAGVNGAYRIALLQNTTPLGNATWVERKVAHDFADNPEGTSNYVFGPFFNYEHIAENLPSRIVVQPETYAKHGDDFVYTPLGAALTLSGSPAALTDPDLFVLEGVLGKEYKNGAACTWPTRDETCCDILGGIWLPGDGVCLPPKGT